MFAFLSVAHVFHNCFCILLIAETILAFLPVGKRVKKNFLAIISCASVLGLSTVDATVAHQERWKCHSEQDEEKPRGYFAGENRIYQGLFPLHFAV